jgi:hypothetical protein
MIREIAQHRVVARVPGKSGEVGAIEGVMGIRCYKRDDRVFFLLSRFSFLVAEFSLCLAETPSSFPAHMEIQLSVAKGSA